MKIWLQKLRTHKAIFAFGNVISIDDTRTDAWVNIANCYGCRFRHNNLISGLSQKSNKDCFRMRIYAGFTLSECACIMSGLGAYPASSKARPGQGPTKLEELKEEGAYSSLDWEVSVMEL